MAKIAALYHMLDLLHTLSKLIGSVSTMTTTAVMMMLTSVTTTTKTTKTTNKSDLARIANARGKSGNNHHHNHYYLKLSFWRNGWWRYAVGAAVAIRLWSSAPDMPHGSTILTSSFMTTTTTTTPNAFGSTSTTTHYQFNHLNVQSSSALMTMVAQMTQAGCGYAQCGFFQVGQEGQVQIQTETTIAPRNQPHSAFSNIEYCSDATTTAMTSRSTPCAARLRRSAPFGVSFGSSRSSMSTPVVEPADASPTSNVSTVTSSLTATTTLTTTTTATATSPNTPPPTLLHVYNTVVYDTPLSLIPSESTHSNTNKHTTNNNNSNSNTQQKNKSTWIPQKALWSMAPSLDYQDDVIMLLPQRLGSTKQRLGTLGDHFADDTSVHWYIRTADPMDVVLKLQSSTTAVPQQQQCGCQSQ
jgi:hypothetical protein